MRCDAMLRAVERRTVLHRGSLRANERALAHGASEKGTQVLRSGVDSTRLDPLSLSLLSSLGLKRVLYRVVP